MILIQRQYASTRNDGAGGVPGCSQQVTFGVDYGPIGLPYDPNLMETPNFATPYLKRACSAIVVNNKGEGICLQELPVKGQPGVYTLANRGSSLSMWQRLLDADPFSGAGTTSGERWMADQLTLPK